jgi:hypothetical protein
MVRVAYKIILTILFCYILFAEYFSAAIFSQKQFKIEKQGDVTIVSNPKKPIPKNGLKKRIVFKEELSIGEIEGDDNYMFGEFIIFNTDDKGNFYVSDIDNHRIQKYDSKGNYLLTIGRKGQGPGEFEDLSKPQFDKENNLYIYDIGNKRISFFDRDGKFLRQINAPRMSTELAVNSENMIVGSSRKFSREKDSYKVFKEFGIFDEEFNQVKILYKDEESNKGIEGVKGLSAPQMLFKPYLIFNLADNDMIYTGYPEKYEIKVYNPEGKLLRRIQRDYDLKPVTREDKEYVYEQSRKHLSEGGIPEHLIKEFIKMITFTKYKPVYRRFTLMENGWLFIIVNYTEDKHTIIDLYNKKGRYIAQFESRHLSLQLFFKNGKAYDLVREEDFPFVKRYTIELQEYKNNKWIKSTIKLY